MHRVGMPSAYSSVSDTSATSALQLRRILGDVLGDGFAADFFFAFDQKLQR